MTNVTTWNPQIAYQNDAVANAYDAARFTSLTGRLGDWKEKRALRRALRAADGLRHALDAACGTGRMTEVLLEHGLDVTGVDISGQMMQRAAQKLARFADRLGFHQSDLAELPFENDRFDLVNCSRLFGHYPSADRISMLRELARVSRRYLIVQYFHRTPITRLKRWIKRRVLRTYAGVVHPVGESTLTDELAAAGLVEVKRCWARRWYSEELFILCRKANGDAR